MTAAVKAAGTLDVVRLTAELVRCPSVTPHAAGTFDLLEGWLRPLGFDVERPVFSETGQPDVENLFAVRRGDGRHLTFAGHTDVVPPGDAAAWTDPPFEATIRDGRLYGRGAVDMKGGVAAFVAAAADCIAAKPLDCTVSLLITGDEEGPGINGTSKLLQWAAERGERFDAAIVGEPSSAAEIGDTIKVGRRGSLTGRLVVHGTQGHAAYPDRAENPVRGIVTLVSALLDPPLDSGTDRFQPSNLEVTSIDVGNPTTNVIPASATADFNVRFNDRWTTESLKAELLRRLEATATAPTALRPKSERVRYSVEWRDRPSPCFLTSDEVLIGMASEAVEHATGRRPSLSTGGGTSDARFIKDYCPVIEVGVVGTTMHQINENVRVVELEMLQEIYSHMIRSWNAR